jgi:hypothetical protein
VKMIAQFILSTLKCNNMTMYYWLPLGLRSEVGIEVAGPSGSQWSSSSNLTEVHPHQSVVHIWEVDYFVLPHLGVWLHSRQR